MDKTAVNHQGISHCVESGHPACGVLSVSLGVCLSHLCVVSNHVNILKLLSPSGRPVNACWCSVEMADVDHLTNVCTSNTSPCEGYGCGIAFGIVHFIVCYHVCSLAKLQKNRYSYCHAPFRIGCSCSLIMPLNLGLKSRLGHNMYHFGHNLNFRFIHA